MSLPVPVYQSGIWNTAVAISCPNFSTPIPRVETMYVVTQDFQMASKNFVPLALNTKFSEANDSTYEEAFTIRGLESKNFYLVSESNFSYVGSMVQWTRTYAMIPEDHSDPTSVTYQFPGYAGGSSADQLRNPISKTVVGETKNHYALIESDGDILSLETFLSQKYLNPVDDEVDTLFSDLNLNVTNPSIETYKRWIAKTGAANPATDDYTIIAQDSRWSIWMGNILRRETIYILPQ